MIRCIKKGLIYLPTANWDWSLTHSQVPVADFISKNKIRIYFATRDKKNISRTSYVDVEASNPLKVIYIHDKPVLDIGKIGTFDDCGVMPSCIVNHDGKKYMYYIGWTIRNTIPYHNSIGLAVSEDGGETFKKIYQGPILTSTPKEPYFCGTSYVIIENNIWKMWYLSCTGWVDVDGKIEPLYHIKYASSRDGINWQRDGIVAIDYKNTNEGGIVSASVLKENEIYKMWYSYRNFFDYRTNKNNSYRIGYAESQDGIKWQRLDEKFEFIGNNSTENSWDSIMNCYPNVIKFNDKKYMFYNGNGFGKSGFGYAIIE